MSLITVEELATYRNLSKKLDTGKLNEAIDLAQQSDLIAILGDFYFDVETNASESNWADLMDGCTFDYLDETFKHVGIKALLADYSYARFLYMANVNATPFGLIAKTTQDSEQTDRATVRDLTKQAQQDAGFKFIYIEKYIMSDEVLFSRYCKNNKKDTSFASHKIYRI